MKGDMICKAQDTDFINVYSYYWGFPWWLISNESACNAGAMADADLIPWLGRSPGGEKWQPTQYSCLETLMEEEPGGLQSIVLQRVVLD